MDIHVFMPLITEAAQAKQAAHEALAFAKKHERESYEKKMEQAKQHLLAAHRKQTDLLTKNARESQTPITIYLIHAMDHVTNAGMMCELTEELAELNLKINFN